MYRDSIFTEWIKKPNSCYYEYGIEMKSDTRECIYIQWPKIKASYRKEIWEIIHTCDNEPDTFCDQKPQIMILCSICLHFFDDSLDFRHTFYIVLAYYIKKCHSHKLKFSISASSLLFIPQRHSKYQVYLILLIRFLLLIQPWFMMYLVVVILLWAFVRIFLEILVYPMIFLLVLSKKRRHIRLFLVVLW